MREGRCLRVYIENPWVVGSSPTLPACGEVAQLDRAKSW